MKNILVLFCFCLAMNLAWAQKIPYGTNAVAGKKVNTNGADIYYETYGNGPALLLLHGDVFGYIDEFADYIPLLSKHFKVIAIAWRGHGRSEIGPRPFSYELFAKDALAVLKNEQINSVIVLGFSAGAVVGYYLAAHHPGTVTKLVAMGGGTTVDDFQPGVVKELSEMHIDILSRKYPDFIKYRKSQMVDPGAYQEMINRLKATWFARPYVAEEALKQIKAPVMVMGGDRDDYISPEGFAAISKRIPGAQLCILPGCNHVGLIQSPGIFEQIVIPFLLK